MSLQVRETIGWDDLPHIRNSSFFSRALIEEAFSHQNWINPPQTRIIYPGDYRGRWFNVRNGVRSTTNSPNTDQRILLVGGSTVYGAEVPDDFTIASYLQGLINEWGSGKFAVLNLGASGVNVSQQLERLKTLTFGPHDIVIFYDGTADAMQGVFYANFDGWIVGENRKRLDNVIARHRTLLETLARHSRFFNWLFVGTTNYLPEHMKHPEVLTALAANTRAKLIAGLLDANAYVQSKGARFIHVLQPDLFSRPVRAFERPMIINHFLTMNGVEPALLAAHNEFVSLTQTLREHEVDAYDASKIFNAIDDPIFFDFAHTNQVGNRIIADFLFGILSREGLFSAGDPTNAQVAKTAGASDIRE